jgi:putative solute:sodium symporter small subunit
MPQHTPDLPARDGPELPQQLIAACLRRYWRRNVRIMALLLGLWALLGLGCGVLWADRLNALPVKLGGFPLGFWFAQQGSIAAFVLIILAYCVLLNRLDREHHQELSRLRRRPPEA